MNSYFFKIHEWAIVVRGERLGVQENVIRLKPLITAFAAMT